MKSTATSDRSWHTEERIPTLGDRLQAIDRSVKTALVMLDRANALRDAGEEAIEGSSVSRYHLEREALEQLREAHEEMYWILISYDVEKNLGLLTPDDDQKEALKRAEGRATSARNETIPGRKQAVANV